MRERENVCNYLDIALQHSSDHMLTAMRRNFSSAETFELITKIRSEVPGIHLRTTMLVGHPGETEEDFEQLKEFVRWARFERLGAFAYSHEEGTYAHKHYTDNIPDEIKQQRLSELMEIQQQIAAEINSAKIGQMLRVIIDRKEDAYFIGRTEFDSPEVDPEVMIPTDTRGVKVGEFYQAKIVDATDFELFGQ